MRPLRVKLTNKLVESYKLDQKMKVHRPRPLSYEELNMFHADGALLPLRLPRAFIQAWAAAGHRR